MSNLFEDIFSVGLEDETDASPTTEESTPVDTAADTGKTDLNAVGQAQQEQSESTAIDGSTTAETDATDSDATDSDEVAADKNTQETVEDESVKVTDAAPTNQPVESEDGKTIIEKELGYYCRILNFAQFKDAKEAVKIEDYYTSTPKSEEVPLNTKTRVRKIDSKEGVRYELTLKVGNDMTQRTENTVEITEDTFNLYCKIAKECTIKHRYTFDNEDGHWCVDLFPNGSGGYSNWARVEVEVNDIPEHAPKPPIEAEEVIYPKGSSNNTLSDEEVDAKISEISKTIHNLHKPNPILVNIRNQIEAKINQNQDTVGGQDNPPEYAESTPSNDDVEDKGNPPTETTDTTETEETPLTADDISRDAEQVKENEEQIEENDEIKEENGDDTVDTDEENTEGETDDSDATDLDSTESSSDATVDESVFDENVGDDDSDREGKTGLGESEDSKAEGKVKAIESLESLVRLRHDLSHTRRYDRFSPKEIKAIHDKVESALPESIKAKGGYRTGLEDLTDHSEGFKEESIDVIQHGIEEILAELTQVTDSELSTLASPSVSGNVNLNSTRLRIEHNPDFKGQLTLNNEESTLVGGKGIIENTRTVNDALNNLTSSTRLNVYVSILKAIAILLKAYAKEGMTSEFKENLDFFNRSVRDVAKPKGSQEDGSVFYLDTPSHRLTYHVSLDEANHTLNIKMESTLNKVSMESSIEIPSNKEMDKVMKETIQTKVNVSEWLSHIHESFPTLVNEVRNEIKAFRACVTNDSGISDIAVFVSINSALSLISNEVEFIATLSGIDSELKDWAAKMLQSSQSA